MLAALRGAQPGRARRCSTPEVAAGVIGAVEPGKVRAIIPSGWRVLDFVRVFGVNLGNALLRARGQLDAIRDLDSV